MRIDCNHLWRKMDRKDATRILTAATMLGVQYRNKLFEQVSVSKTPAIIPDTWDAKYHIDVCTLERQRRRGNKPFRIDGYEIKSSRADFTADKKWHNYIGRTDRFFFVTPPGIIKKTELASGVGLIECNLWKYSGGELRETLKWIVWSNSFQVDQVARFDTMYALATANDRASKGYRRTLRKEIRTIIKKLEERDGSENTES